MPSSLRLLRLVSVWISICAAAPLVACGNDGEAVSGTGADGVGGEAGSGSDGGEPPPTELEPSLAFMSALSGLWVGPVTMTPLGEFPTMNMDARSPDGRTLFCSSDLDRDNALRFAFALEDHGHGPELIYRNGGLFTSLVRDSRTRVKSADPGSGVWRFCSIDRGCDYIDATFEVQDDELLLDVKVRGEQHVWWTATRAESRSLPQPFPVDTDAVGDGGNDFPPMPSLELQVSWDAPLAEAADVWVILSTTTCGATGDCTPSRTFSVEAPAGATSVSATIEQIHSGEYFGSALLDRNRNFFTTLFPDAGDSVSIPDAPVEIPPSGPASAQFSILVDI